MEISDNERPGENDITKVATSTHVDGQECKTWGLRNPNYTDHENGITIMDNDLKFK